MNPHNIAFWLTTIFYIIGFFIWQNEKDKESKEFDKENWKD